MITLKNLKLLLKSKEMESIMKKRILIATSLLVILIIGSISVYATSFESNIDIMEKVGQLYLIRKKVIILFLQKGNQVELLQKTILNRLPNFTF